MSTLKKAYCKSVIAFTRTYAVLARAKRQLDDGEVVSESELMSLSVSSALLEKNLDQMQRLRTACGYSTSLGFLADDVFDGFSIKGGELVGDLSKAYQIAQPWFCDFISGSSDNAFLFEVASLIRSLTDVDEVYSLSECRDRT